ncbi:EpsG family protein [Shewanella sp. MBTL60-112-B1]|uniref:EpsG family protein n=1 Tax=Shewanella sp. MBTL60-112-B1 TaxID=2815916 RepID=UPI001C7D3974|nr:EpsG family protein [Shewanella sp. MBTL60-112-B1]
MFYYALFFILSIVVFLEPKNTTRQEKLFFLMLHFFLLLAFVGLRDETGTDWINYSDQFFSDDNDHMEFGYLYLSDSFRYLVSDYNVFVFFHAAMYLSIFFIAINKKLKIGYIVLLLYTGHLLGVMGSNRQVLALMFCILAGERLYQDKIKTFVVIVMFAAIFHYSSLIFLLMYYVRKMSVRMSLSNYLFVFVVLAFANYILLSSSFISTISNQLITIFSEGTKLRGQLIVYGSDQFRPDIITSIMMTIKRVSTLFILIVMIVLFVDRNPNVGFTVLGRRFKFYFAAYFFSIILLLLFQPIYPIIATRGGLYFYIYEIFLFSIIVSKVKQVNYTIFTVIFILFCLVRLSFQFSYDKELLVPYKAVWYNTDVIRHLY